jgi:hypothetical protein
MEFSGPLQKMMSHPANPVVYYLQLGSDLLKMNDLLGKQLRITPLHRITCHCGLEVPKVFRQNFCYNCFYSKPEAGDAIFHPEKSTAHLGVADRDLAFEAAYQLQPHVVYLANSGGLKVGVTRAAQMTTRWIDQGASAAIVLAQTTNRYEAGLIEVALKNHFSDKTHWQNMLVGNEQAVDLIAEKEKAKGFLSSELQGFCDAATDEIHKFQYPQLTNFSKVKSVKISASDSLETTLVGIRGQYLMFENGAVTNIRSQEGQWVSVAF